MKGGEENQTFRLQWLRWGIHSHLG